MIMNTIHYRLNNNKFFNFYSFVEDVTEEELKQLQQKLHIANGKDSVMKLFVADDKQRVIMASSELSAKDKEIITKMNYTFKRGYDL